MKTCGNCGLGKTTITTL